MTAKNVEVSIMFADVVESTRLYESLGDEKAQAAVAECLAFVTSVVERHNGIVIKTIGDEVMSLFPLADDAVKAACEIQEVNEAGQTYAGERLALRAGLHHGPAILENDDVFGDAVNVASRMAGIAKATQVITTGETVEKLTGELRERAREFDIATVRGKQEEIRIFDVVWEKDGEITKLVGLDNKARPRSSILKLRYGNEHLEINSAEQAVFALGRATHCDLIVPGPLASRVHCRFEFRRGKFVLVDQSTNGTFVRTQDGEDIYLRREQLLLWGAGIISLGEEITDSNPFLVHFLCP